MNVPGITAKHCIISPMCRVKKTHEVAWLEACDRLRKEYYAICAQRADIDDCDFHLVLAVDTPRHKLQRAKDEGRCTI